VRKKSGSTEIRAFFPDSLGCRTRQINMGKAFEGRFSVREKKTAQPQAGRCGFCREMSFPEVGLVGVAGFAALAVFSAAGCGWLGAGAAAAGLGAGLAGSEAHDGGHGDE
jgi:hypothetical protein